MGRPAKKRRQKLPAEPIELRIHRLGHDGRGISDIDGKIAFVEGALPGERVMAAFVSRRSQYDELRATEILESSADRCEPVCTWANVCGGCSLQHMTSETQIALKQQTLFDQLLHSAGLSDQYERLPPLLAASTSYRRKARLAVRYVHKKESVLVGFREKNGTFIADMNGCAVLERDVAGLIAPLRILLGNLQGKRDIPQIEVAVGEQESETLTDNIRCQVALIVRHMEPLVDEDLAALVSFAKARGIELYLQPGGPASVHRIWPQDGEERLHYYLPDFGLKMAFHPTDFTQVNGAINRLMIGKAVEMLDLQAEDRVLDLFCGLGNFTLPIATRCAHVTGVEGSQEMVHRGNENARLNGLVNVDFHSADLSADLSTQPWSRERYTKILLDPPRSGAQEIVQQIAGYGAQKIVYISCNPATLARDAGILVKQGYQMTKAGIMDMFPHTGHVESIAEFVQEKKKRKW
jgi:23S rRNA (uracil1939-C5)-methyltransferase